MGGREGEMVRERRLSGARIPSLVRASPRLAVAGLIVFRRLRRALLRHVGIRGLGREVVELHGVLALDLAERVLRVGGHALRRTRRRVQDVERVVVPVRRHRKKKPRGGCQLSAASTKNNLQH